MRSKYNTMHLWNSGNLLLSVALFVPSLYLWRKFYKTYVTLKKDLDDYKLFQERHDCIIMYSRKYIRGWPPNKTIKIEVNNVNLFTEPYTYFITTAKHTLDIAVMTIGIRQIFDALHEALKNGVKIRLLVNFLSVKRMKNEYNQLMKAGAKVALYVDKSEQLNNIMHLKYMIKDYKHQKSGYICMGSMNFRGIGSVLDNFEDVVFSSNIYLIDSFYVNFVECWNMVQNDNKNFFNKTALADAGFLQ